MYTTLHYVFISLRVDIYSVCHWLCFRERNCLLKEAEVLHKARFNYIIQIFGICNEPEFFCIVTEFMSNGSLDLLLHEVAIHVYVGRYSSITRHIRHTLASSFSLKRRTNITVNLLFLFWHFVIC